MLITLLFGVKFCMGTIRSVNRLARQKYDYSLKPKKNFINGGLPLLKLHYLLSALPPLAKTKI